MPHILHRRVIAAAVVSALSVLGGLAHAAGHVGPSSSATPYLVGVHPGVDLVSILTVGDSVNDKPDGQTPYRLVGIPDGLGAYDNGDGTFTVLMNHELGGAAGTARQHGAAGAFVSQWTVRKADLKVLHGGDLIKQVYTWDKATARHVAATTVFNRFCSADLAAPTAFYNAATGKGYTGRIFLNGEESGAEGRAFAHIASGPTLGTSYELPYLGRFSWENALANPAEQDKTVVIGTDDSTPGQLYVYVGDKQSTGNEIEKAGLQGGALYGIQVAGVTLEDRSAGIAAGTAFTLAPLANVQNKTGAQLQADSVAAGITEFLRPEDGAWDPRDPNVFYFATTDRFDAVKAGTGTNVGRSRLYRLTFADIANPTAGGRIDTVVDGSGPNQMFDNLTIDGAGNAIAQEDPGNQAHLARIWHVNTRSGALTELAQADPARFALPTAPFTQDEETSGVIEVTDLLVGGDDHDDADKADHGRHGPRASAWRKAGQRYFLAVVQAHYGTDAELVEGGQLVLMSVPRHLSGSRRR